MNPEIKKKWVDALKSGEYKQGHYELRQDDEYCCLGVLCDLHAKETGNKWTDDPVTGACKYLGVRAVLPYLVVQWADLEINGSYDGDIRVRDSGHDRSLIALNDAVNYTFDKIADAIEKGL